MNKTSRVEFTVELVRILTAIAIAYAVALVTLRSILSSSSCWDRSHL